jgi:hypothetical protein
MPAISSFKDELARYDPEPVEIDADVVRINPKPDQLHIRRWAEHDNAQEVWRNIKEKAPALEAQEFIRAVVSAWHGALGLIQNAADLEILRNRAKKMYRAEINKLLVSQLSIPEMASRLEDFAKGLRQWDDWPPGPFVPYGVKVSRKDQKGSRVRKIFAQQVSDFLHKHCGVWLDEEVATLTEIAFPGRELHADDIRANRRPTKTSERSRRKAPRL